MGILHFMNWHASRFDESRLIHELIERFKSFKARFPLLSQQYLEVRAMEICEHNIERVGAQLKSILR